MTFTLNDAAQLIPRLALNMAIDPPHERVSPDAPWSYAETSDGQRVGKHHTWRIEADRFIASGVWHEDEPDEDARAVLQGLIDDWTAAGKEDAVAALNCCEHGIHWDQITKKVERPFLVDVPLAGVTFTRYWWDRPTTVSWSQLGAMGGD